MKFSDAHNDIYYLTRDKNKIAKYFNQDIMKNAEHILCAYYTANNQIDAGVKQMKDCFKILKKVSKKTIPTVENCWFLTQKNIEHFIKLKPFCCALTHSHANALCGDAMEDYGFTSWGREVVKLLESNNITIDTAHMGRKSFFEFVNLTTKPILTSHTALDYYYEHPRNLSKTQIEIIKSSGGYIGLAFYNKFFGREIDAKFLAEIVYNFIQIYDINILGLGTDFNGIELESCPIDIKNYDALPKLKDEFNKLNIPKHIQDKFFYHNLENVIKKQG